MFKLLRGNSVVCNKNLDKTVNIKLFYTLRSFTTFTLLIHWSILNGSVSIHSSQFHVNLITVDLYYLILLFNLFISYSIWSSFLIYSRISFTWSFFWLQGFISSVYLTFLLLYSLVKLRFFFSCAIFSGFYFVFIPAACNELRWFLLTFQDLELFNFWYNYLFFRHEGEFSYVTLFSQCLSQWCLFNHFYNHIYWKFSHSNFLPLDSNLVNYIII